MIKRARTSMAWAVGTLRAQRMPGDEIRAVLAADDPDIVRRYLELHQERLEERVTEQRRTLARIESLLTQAVRRPL